MIDRKVYIPEEMMAAHNSARAATAAKVPLLPMSPLIASSTVVNLLLATGPFT